MKDYDIESYIEAKQEEYENTHPVCPSCNSYMKLVTENFGQIESYAEEWYECPQCGYCMNA